MPPRKTPKPISVGPYVTTGALCLAVVTGLAISWNMSSPSSFVRPLSTVAQTASSSSSSDPLDAPIVNPSFVSYLGRFRMPDVVTVPGGPDTTPSGGKGGLAFRYVGGSLRFFTSAHVYQGGLIYETNYPGVSTTEPSPVATVVKPWGDVYQGHKCEVYENNVLPRDCALHSGLWTHGLYFDQSSNRLYWNYGSWYDTYNYNGKPAFGYSVLNDATGTSTAYGPWGLAGKSAHWIRAGITPIPDWFATRFTGGKRLGVGFGGIGYSIIAPGSMGPAVTAIDPPGTSTGTALPNVSLLGYPYNNVAYTQPDRVHRPANYIQSNDSWAARGSIGYPTWSDGAGQNCTMVSDATFQGLVCLTGLAEGRETYHNAGIIYERMSYWWSVFDLKDVSKVATGAKQMWEIQPIYQWRDPVLSQNPHADTLDFGGITYDGTAKRLYVELLSGWKSGCCTYPPAVYVYQLAAPTADPVITQSPLPSNVLIGSPATFSVTAKSAGTLTYQWQRQNNSGATWMNIAGATAPTYTIVPTAQDSGAFFRCIVSRGATSVTSDSAELFAIVPGPPVIVAHPQNVTVPVGGMATFYVQPNGNPAHYFYIWQRSSDGGQTWISHLGNGNSWDNPYSYGPVTAGDTGTLFRAMVYQNDGSTGMTQATSNTATLTVGTPLLPPLCVGALLQQRTRHGENSAIANANLKIRSVTGALLVNVTVPLDGQGRTSVTNSALAAIANDAVTPYNVTLTPEGHLPVTRANATNLFAACTDLGTAKAGDFDGNGTIGISDLVRAITHYRAPGADQLLGRVYPTPPLLADLVELISNYRTQ